MRLQGTLIPIGGNEDKGLGKDEMHTLDFVEEGILSHVVKEGGGTDANIVIIPTASSIPIEVGENYLAAFRKLGCRNLAVMDIRERSEAFGQEYVDLVLNADIVMMSGGDQSRIANIIGGSPIHNIMMNRLINEEGFVLAGTSAGAMAMSTEMICGGSSTEALQKGSVRMMKGLNLIPQLIIDSHFIQRGRFGRLAEAVARFPHLMGVGLAEDTGIVVKNGNDCKVIGSGMVIMFDPSELTHNNSEILEVGTPMTIFNLKTHVLSNSDRFQIEQRKLEVLPIDAPFE
jgi:cyanophycinase